MREVLLRGRRRHAVEDLAEVPDRSRLDLEPVHGPAEDPCKRRHATVDNPGRHDEVEVIQFGVTLSAKPWLVTQRDPDLIAASFSPPPTRRSARRCAEP